MRIHGLVVAAHSCDTHLPSRDPLWRPHASLAKTPAPVPQPPCVPLKPRIFLARLTPIFHTPHIAPKLCTSL